MPNRAIVAKNPRTIMVMLRLMDKYLTEREKKKKFKLKLKYSGSRLRKISGEKIVAAKRFALDAKVILHKNGRYIKGRVVNVSSSGIFIRADRKVFEEREKIRLYIRPSGVNKSYRSIGTIVRYSDVPGREGYGIRFSTF